MKLYLMYLLKGKQLFHIGDNIKDYLEYKEEFEDKKELNWGIDFYAEINSANITMKSKKGLFYNVSYSKYEPIKSEKQLINQCFVICTKSGIIKGIMELNKNNREEL